MRLRLTLFVALLLVCLVAPHAISRPATARRQIQRYQTPWGMRYAHFWDEYAEMVPERPALVFRPRAGDRSVIFHFDPDDNRPAYVHIRQGSGEGATDRYFCGRKTWFDLDGTTPVEVKVYVGACENHLIAYGVSGRITAVFSRSAAAAAAAPHHH